MAWSATYRYALIIFILMNSVALAEAPVRSYTYTEGEVISATKVTTNEDNLYNYLSRGVDTYADSTIVSADITNDTIVNADISSSAAIADSKLAQITTASKISGAALTSLANIPSGAGYIPTANLGSGSASASTFLRGDQSYATASTSPAGSNTQVQFNDSSSFGGDAGLTYNKTSDELSLDANFLINGATAGTSGDGVISLKKGTAPSSSPTDCGQLYADGVTAYPANTTVLLHMNGTDGSTTFTDEVGKTFTATNQAQIDTAQQKFGTASGLFDGTSDYISTPDHADFNFGAGDFTIDFQLRFNTTVGADLFTQYGSASDIADWFSYGGGNLTFKYSTSGSTWAGTANFAWTPSTATWYHIELVRSGANLYCFVDGTQIGSTFDIGSATIFNSTATVQIGHDPEIGNNLNGWLDEYRVSNVARHTANFTPPTSAYSGPAELRVRDESGNVTTISPHNISKLPNSIIDKNDVIVAYYSKNEYLGKEVAIDWVSLIKDLELITGKQYMYVNNIRQKAIDEQTYEKMPEWYKKRMTTQEIPEPTSITVIEPTIAPVTAEEVATGII